jgi:hypothetical protein
VNASLRRQLARRKRRILRRIENRPGVERPEPMMSASNIHYEIGDRTRAIAPGGIGAIHTLARRLGLVHDIDEGLQLLKRHMPYHESDHALKIAYNLLAGGQRLEHLEVRRNDEVYLDALGAERIPDPTTAGDFCRRFGEDDVERLMGIFNEVRLRAWRQQPEEFFDEAFLDADGTLAPTEGWCKQGVDISYKGTWGYHPLVVSLASTAEPLFLVNRSGNRPSHEHADGYLDKAAAPCRRAGFRRITLRGDTDFTQTRHLDRWDADGIRFLFGIDAMPNLKDLAERLPELKYSELERPPRYTIKTAPRRARERHKERIVSERQFDTLKLLGEETAEFEYRPVACKTTYRVVVLRKKLVVEIGAVVAVRARPLLLLHHQRSHDTGAGDRVPGQRPLRPGEPDRAAQGRGEGAGDAGRRPGEQLGVHGDGQPGVEPEGRERPGAPRARPVGGEVSGREAVAAADGVQHVLRGDDPGPLPDRQASRPDHLPVAIVEPVAGRVPEVGGAVARSPVVLNRWRPEAGVRMLRSVLAPYRREAVS